jgi:MFS family permease
MHSTLKPLSLKQVLFCGAMIVTLSMGIRHGFGLWLQPITQEQGWSRQSFSLALAIQNLSWGVIGVFAGMLADKLGAFRVLVAGAVLYALGLAGMALSPTPLMFALTAGVLIGAAQAGTTYAVIYGVIGRQIPVERRSWAMGVAAAAGSFGQFLMVPVEGHLIAGFGWQTALLVLALMVLLIVPLALGLREPRHTGGAVVHREQTILQAVGEAFKYPSFVLLMAGYFVCGFQLAFIGVHMPSYRPRWRAMRWRWSGCSTSSAPTSRARWGPGWPSASCWPPSTSAARRRSRSSCWRRSRRSRCTCSRARWASSGCRPCR